MFVALALWRLGPEARGRHSRPACESVRNRNGSSVRNGVHLRGGATTRMLAGNESASRPPADPNELLIVGPGVLGRAVAAMWHEKYPSSRIVAESRTPASHGVLRATLPFLELRLADAATYGLDRFRRVVFCAPPSQNEDYVAAVRRAVERYWVARTPDTETAAFVFTSSIGVYREPLTPTVLREDSPVVTDPTEPGASPSALKLLACEQVVRDAGGTVLRLAGLYTLERGPHRFWLSRGTVTGGPPDGLISLVSYHDAARAVVAALEQPGLERETLVVADAKPLSRREICEVARRHPMYAKSPMPVFTAESEAVRGGGSARPAGKRFDTSRSRAKLGQFRYDFESFEEYVQRCVEEGDDAAQAPVPLDRI
ncbi:hypothetical protein, conserved [Cyanidioschyzon merolae strain 10D]|jgi:nucleoside-diphosphate-sugar epimerase|uniref:NAD-dependent epimerase/dehydratase domain-containing protein n=1 Tax=Cyanidioschyzon merolae (strain NIES-3377 / 10D) TaxID=280699 RepID=M1V610_CYAM1|nr:hypothetical protein, conserved [Cyanidioschyzon merolae strain 10D]BAM81605.1 hypothetical protein, conserved [Cyanidioschyzon merolae strain 10D]|eukprot:XP_005537641.1 hypothetical protein, conserved [Cyanidioschyzon merolae strain 10D]